MGGCLGVGGVVDASWSCGGGVGVKCVGCLCFSAG